MAAKTTHRRGKSPRSGPAKRRQPPALPGRNGQPETPVWDTDRRELRLGENLIKKFHNPAPCQEAILAAFQEEGWPERIDDPLPFAAGKNMKRRLHNAINCLNRSHLVKLMRFHGDGKGEGVTWSRL